MRYRFTYLIILFLIVIDLAIINISFLASFFLIDSSIKNLAGQVYKDYFIVYNLIWLLSAATFRLYYQETLRNLESIFRATFRSMLLQQFLWLGYFLFTKDFGYSRQFLIMLFVFLIVGFAASRFLLTVLEIYYRRYKKFRQTVAIVGFNPTGVKLAEYFERHKGEYHFRGFLDEKGKNFPLQSGPAGIYMKSLLVKAKARNIDEVFAAVSPTQLKDVRGMIETADELMIKLRLVPDLSGAMALTRLQVRYLDNLPVLAIRREPLEDSGARFKKRMLDLLVSILVGIFILSWLIPIIGLLIKIDSKGPVFFWQLRSGRNNQPFWCYKFRSMYVNDTSDSVQASKDDARITKMGAFLRRTSLDELPQFWNVLKGNMSIVGPRPHMLAHTEQYRKIIDGFMVRHFLKPGITGWAQVTGFRGETKDPKQMEERVIRDVWYLENWSLMLDVRIIFLTVWVVLKGDENAF
jgi:putative colanic acid biosysnthesis UDP-glucose lipid carrier transferase